MVVSIKTKVSINPREQKLIWVCVNKEDFEGLSLETLLSDPWVCHSEDIDNIIMDERNMHIWYTSLNYRRMIFHLKCYTIIARTNILTFGRARR